MASSCKIIKTLILTLLPCLLAACMALPDGPDAGKEIVLPADDGYIRGQPVQWWYWSGHLASRDGRRFGFELVFFAFQPNVQFAQAAITDIDNAGFHYDSVTRFKIPVKMPAAFDLSSNRRINIQATGGNGSDHLYALVDGYQLDIRLQAVKPAVLHYRGRPYQYSFGGHSYYYSRPRMDASGVISINGKDIEVSGEAWFDRQYGDLEKVLDRGWQWFGVQLEDHSEITAFFFDGGRRHPDDFLVITDAGSISRKLPPDAYKLTIIDTWQSPVTACRYPVKWTLEINGAILEIEPYLKDQELRPKSANWLIPTYWEGAAAVKGDRSGKAFVELHGFCDKE